MILLRTPNNSTVNPIKLELLLMKSLPSTWRLPKKLETALLMIDQYTPGLTVVVPTKAAKVPRVVVSWEMVIAKAEVTSKAAVTRECNRICLSSDKTEICLRFFTRLYTPCDVFASWLNTRRMVSFYELSAHWYTKCYFRRQDAWIW